MHPFNKKLRIFISMVFFLPQTIEKNMLNQIKTMILMYAWSKRVKNHHIGFISPFHILPSNRENCPRRYVSIHEHSASQRGLTGGLWSAFNLLVSIRVKMRAGARVRSVISLSVERMLLIAYRPFVVWLQ